MKKLDLVKQLPIHFPVLTEDRHRLHQSKGRSSGPLPSQTIEYYILSQCKIPLFLL